MNEQVKPGDWVMILEDNYRSAMSWSFKPGTIGKVYGGGGGIFYVYVETGALIGMSDDLGYYSYKKLDYRLLDLIKL